MQLMINRLKGQGFFPQWLGRGHDKLVFKPHYDSPYVLKIAWEGFIDIEKREREYIQPENMIYWAPTLFLRFFEVQQFGWPVNLKPPVTCTRAELQPHKDAAKLDGFDDLGHRPANFCLFGPEGKPMIIDANHTSRRQILVSCK